jgi:CRISPR-associated protein Cas1
MSKFEVQIPLNIKERILNITPDERRILGINKSTLWYQQKKILEGRRLKVYGKVLSRLP